MKSLKPELFFKMSHEIYSYGEGYLSLPSLSYLSLTSSLNLSIYLYQSLYLIHFYRRKISTILFILNPSTFLSSIFTSISMYLLTFICLNKDGDHDDHCQHEKELMMVVWQINRESRRRPQSQVDLRRSSRTRYQLSFSMADSMRLSMFFLSLSLHNFPRELFLKISHFQYPRTWEAQFQCGIKVLK